MARPELVVRVPSSRAASNQSVSSMSTHSAQSPRLRDRIASISGNLSQHSYRLEPIPSSPRSSNAPEVPPKEHLQPRAKSKRSMSVSRWSNLASPLPIHTRRSQRAPANSGLRVQASDASTTASGPPVEATVPDGYSPVWLRRTTVAAFSIFFVFCILAAELTLRYADGDTAHHSDGVWTFAPVVIVSFLLVLWERVEFQAMNNMPWIVLNEPTVSTEDVRRKQVTRTILLDYPSQHLPLRLWTATRNKHTLVFASTCICLFLRIELFLSTGLFTLGISPQGEFVLRMQQGTLHAMSVFFGLMVVLTLPMLYNAPHRQGIAPRDPTSIAGTAALLANSHPLLNNLSETGAADLKSMAERIQGSWLAVTQFRPSRSPPQVYQIRGMDIRQSQLMERISIATTDSLYRPWFMSIFTPIITIVISIILVILLWVLCKGVTWHREFNSASSEMFLWTSFVTMFFVIFAYYLGSISFHLNRLTPFIKLATGEHRFYDALGLTYTNELGFTTVIKSIRLRDWAVLVAGLAAFFGWLMPIFSGGLFLVETFTQAAAVPLQQDTFFNLTNNRARPLPDNSLVDQVLIQSPPQFPPWTYGDMVFPVLSWNPDDVGGLASSDNMNWQVTIPAVTVNLDCKQQSFTGGEGLNLECEAIDGTNTTSLVSCYVENGSHFGFVASKCYNKVLHDASLNYIWGDCSKDGDVTVLSCEEKAYQMEASVALVGGDLQLDPNNQPWPLATTLKPQNSSFTVDGVYDMLENYGFDSRKTAHLDNFFSALVSSRLGIPPERLEGQDRVNSVIQGIKSQHALIRAQLIDGDTIRKTYSTSGPDFHQPGPLNSTCTYTSSHVEMSEPQTIILTVFLLIIVILSAASIYLRPPSNMQIPKNPGSISAHASLLADSTLWYYLPRGVEYLSDDRLARRLRKQSFRMGWFDSSRRVPDGGLPSCNFTVGIVQDNGQTVRSQLESRGKPKRSRPEPDDEQSLDPHSTEFEHGYASSIEEEDEEDAERVEREQERTEPPQSEQP